MNNGLPEDVLEARSLLEKAEAETNHTKRTRDFEDAIDILNDYLAHNPGTPFKNVIEQFKLTYTRKFIEDLSNLLTTDIEIWFVYTKLFLWKVPNEVKSAIENNNHLKKIYKEFFELWRKEAIDILTDDQ